MARVTLSFDNGPHPEGTPRVLDAGHTFATDLPASCLPIVRGQVQPGLRDLVRSPHPSARETHA